FLLGLSIVPIFGSKHDLIVLWDHFSARPLDGVEVMKKRYLSGNRKMTHKSAAVCALVLGLAFALSGVVAARAQNITASVRGTVTDKQGAAIAGAEVTITNNDTGYSRVSISSADGAYSFESLPIGKYLLRATKAGFR